MGPRLAIAKWIPFVWAHWDREEARPCTQCSPAFASWLAFVVIKPHGWPNSPIHRSTPTSAEAIGRTVEPKVMIELYGTEAEGGSVEVAQEAQGE